MRERPGMQAQQMRQRVQLMFMERAMRVDGDETGAAGHTYT